MGVKATVLSSLLAVTSSTYAAQGGGTAQTTDSQNPQYVTINVDQDTTVDSISVGNDAVTKIYVLGKDVKFTVNKDISLNTPSSAGLNFTPSTSSDGNGNITFDKSSSLHVKGDINITNTNTQTELDVSSGYLGIFLGLSPNTTVDGTVNVKSDALHTIKASDTNGNELEIQYPGASLSLSGNSTIEKDLNVDKSHVSASFTPKIDDKTISPQGENERIQINGNATFTDNSSLDVMAKMGVKGDLSFEKSRLYLALNSLFASPMWNLKTAADNIALDVDGNASFTNGSSLDVLGRLKVKGDLSLENSPLYLSTYYSIPYDGKEERVQPVDEASIDIGGNLKISGVTDDGNTIYNTVAGDAILNVAGNVDVSGSNSIEIGENSTATIGGDLNLTHVEDTNVWNKVYNGSSMTVGGNLSLTGLYKEGTGDYSSSASADEYHRNRLFASGEGSSITVKGNTTVTNNAELFAETYSNPIDNPDHDKYIDKTTFKDLGRATFEGDVDLSTNAKLGAYNAGEVTVGGNVNAQTGGNLQAWDSDSSLTVKGDAKFSGSDSRLQAGRTGSIEILGNTDVKDGYVELYDNGSLNIAKNLTSYNGEIVATKNSKINVGGDLNVSQDKDETVWNKIEDGSSMTVGGNLNLSGLYRDPDECDFSTPAGGDYYLRLDLYSTGEGSNLTVKGDSYVTDNAHLFAETYSNPAYTPDHDKYIDKSTFNDIGRAEFAGDVKISRNGILAAYNAGEVTIGGNINVESGGAIKALTSDAAVTVKGNTTISDANSYIQAGNTGSIKIIGNTDVKNGSINIENKATLSIDGNTSIANAGTLFVDDNSTATFGGDLNLTNEEDTNVWNKVYNGSSMTVNGDLNMKGHYREGYYTEETDQEFFRNVFLVSGQDGSGEVVGKGGYLNIKGNVKLTDNSHFFTESYSNTMDQSNPNHNKYFPKDSFEKLTTSLIEGNITLDRNSRLGSYNAGESTVNGNVTATNGASVEAWNSDALLTINGDVSIADTNGKIGVGRTADIDIGGNLSLKNDAKAYVGEESTLTVAKKFLVDNATLEIHGGQLLLSGEDSVLDLTNNGVLKTDEAGSIELEKGASVNAKTKTLLSEDTTTTADGVAEKTFEADALSKVSLVDFNKEVSLDEAKRLHSVLFNSDTGILDLKIASDKPSEPGEDPSKPDSGNASFDDAINAGGTTAVEDKTIADVDTSDKKLSDLTSSDLSWGSASLKDGQTDLDLGSGNLALNNPEANQGSFVSTADGTTGNITMDKDANLALNGNGAIGDVNTTENGTGDILIGNDKTGTVTANNLGSDDKAFGSVSVGSGSSVTVKNILNAAKVALEKKAEVIASVIKSPELKAIGDDIIVLTHEAIA